MQCKDLMRRPVTTVKTSASVASAARAMRDRNIGFLAICDNLERVQGVLTDRDMALRVCAEQKDAADTRVEEIMTRELVSCRASDDVAVASELMSQEKKSRIVVVDDDGRAAGVISLSDLAGRLDSGAARTLRDVASREVLTRGGTTR